MRLADTVWVSVGICLALTPLLSAQEQAAPDPEARGVVRMVQDVSRALQGGNAALFLRFFDRRRFEGYPTLESHIVAMTTQSDIASSIKIVEIESVESGYRLQVDWVLQLSVKDTPGPLEMRREVVEISAAEDRKRRWRITGLEPVDLFRPQAAGQEP